MKSQRIFAIVLRQFYLIRGSVSRILPLFVWVMVDMILWGFITRYLNSVASSGFNFVPALLGAILLWDFLIRVMQGITMAFLEDIWSRNFLNLFVTPLSVAEYVSGLVVTGILTSIVGLVVMILVASFAFGLSLLSYGIALGAFLSILFLCGIALGIACCAIMLRFGPSAEWFIWPIPAIISPFVGVFYPLSTLPHWMQIVSYALPPSYVFESMRTVVFGGTLPVHSLLIGLLLAIVAIALACLFFVRTYRHVVRSGLLARYSAESVL